MLSIFLVAFAAIVRRTAGGAELLDPQSSEERAQPLYPLEVLPGGAAERDGPRVDHGIQNAAFPAEHRQESQAERVAADIKAAKGCRTRAHSDCYAK